MIQEQQPSTLTVNGATFLRGGGEMGHLMRSYEWMQTSIGPPDAWPQSLRTSLSLILNAKSPMFLFWGDELLCFYNDAYRPSLVATGRHPHALGKPGAQVWPEIWDTIEPLLDQVRSGGEAAWTEDQLISIDRNGLLEDVYWSLGYNPVHDESGRIAGVLVVCSETTNKVQTISKLRISEQRFQNLVREASMGIVVLSGENMVITIVNDGYARLIDRSCSELLGKPLFSLIPDAETVFRPIIDTVRLTGQSLNLYSQPYLVRNADGAEIRGFLDLVYQPYKELDGTITGVMVLCQDVTEQKKSEQALKESEERFQAAVTAVQGVLWTNNAVGQMEGEQPGWAALTGQSYAEYQGYGWAKAVHPDDAQPTIDAWNEAVKECCTFVFEHRVQLHNGTWGLFSIRAIPLLAANGEIREWVGVHSNITEQRQAEQALAESEAHFRRIIEEAPVATCLFVGRSMRIDVANEAMIDIWGKGPSVLGMPLGEALPELRGQHFLPLLDELFLTGNSYETKAGRADLVVNGVLRTYYFDYTFKPLRNSTGEVYAIMEMAVDVTEQVISRQKVEEAEVALRGAIEMAELGTWHIDLTTGILDYSARLRGWFGIETDEIITPERAYRPVLAADRPRVRAAIAQAIAPDSDGIYDIEYSIDPAEAGRERVLHIQGRALINEKGVPYKLSGTAQDVTEQRRVQQELKRQVAERTRQLEESVQDLQRSNQNLQQFAYVASHDLQEPLRKVQQFGDLLGSQYADQLGEGINHLQRMQTAAGRMSALIKDLLTFSQISTQQENTAPVSLTQVIETVMNDLELVIEETGAHIDVEPLPTVRGDASQLGQLFQNLLSNALKFRRSGTVPVIKINAECIEATALPGTVKPTRTAAAYSRVDVSDNGIGFDQKYADRIFQVFQRLHGKNEYAGTGIGLAICQKVAGNHGGAITAVSQPGRGTTFSVYLPA